MTEKKKKRIYKKYNGHCAYCGKPLDLSTMTVDHRIPVSNNGDNSIENLLPCYHQCNTEKGSDNLEVFRINAAWTTLKISDLKTFRTFIKSVRKFKFYFEKNK